MDLRQCDVIQKMSLSTNSSLCGRAHIREGGTASFRTPRGSATSFRTSAPVFRFARAERQAAPRTQVVGDRLGRETACRVRRRGPPEGIEQRVKARRQAARNRGQGPTGERIFRRRRDSPFVFRRFMLRPSLKTLSSGQEHASRNSGGPDIALIVFPPHQLPAGFWGFFLCMASCC